MGNSQATKDGDTMPDVHRLSGKLEDAVWRNAERNLRAGLREDGYVYLPIVWKRKGKDSDGWNGKAPRDPLTIYVVDHGTEKILFKTSLRQILKEGLECCAEDGSFSEGLAELSAALKKLSAQIDKVIEKSRHLTDGAK